MLSRNKKFFYRAYSLNISSDIPIPQFPEIMGEKIDVDVRIILKRIKIPLKADVEGINFKVVDGVVYRFWEGIGKFKHVNGREIYVDPVPGLHHKIFTRYLVGTVFGVFLYQKNYFVLHSSAVNIRNNAIAFISKSGTGKSTTAMAFYLNNYPAITDDYLAVNIDGRKIPVVTPGFPAFKLSLDFILTNKIDLDDLIDLDILKIDKNPKKNIFVKVPDGFSEKKLMLKRLYILKRGKNLILKNINPQEAFKELLSNNYTIKLHNNLEQGINLKYYSNIIKNVEIKYLIIPKSFNLLPKVVKIVENDINSEYQ